MLEQSRVPSHTTLNYQPTTSLVPAAAPFLAQTQFTFAESHLLFHSTGRRRRHLLCKEHLLHSNSGESESLGVLGGSVVSSTWYNNSTRHLPARPSQPNYRYTPAKLQRHQPANLIGGRSASATGHSSSNLPGTRAWERHHRPRPEPLGQITK